MMKKIIIDENIYKYRPLFNLSEIDLFEYDLSKYKIVYLYIDNLDKFYNFSYNKGNEIYVIDKDIVFKNNYDIEKISYTIKETNFKKKICKQEYIRNYLWGNNENSI